MGFGGMIAIIGMLFAFGMLSSVMAQNNKFDTIQCSRLKVVDADGEARVILAFRELGGVSLSLARTGNLGRRSPSWSMVVLLLPLVRMENL